MFVDGGLRSGREFGSLGFRGLHVAPFPNADL